MHISEVLAVNEKFADTLIYSRICRHTELLETLQAHAMNTEYVIDAEFADIRSFQNYVQRELTLTNIWPKNN